MTDTSLNAVDAVQALLRCGMPKDSSKLQHEYAYLRNIAYNFQYLEYLSKLLEAHDANEEKLHFTVQKLTRKTFVVTGMGIVEAVIWFLLKKNGHQRISEWEETVRSSSTQFMQGDETFKFDSFLYKKRPEPIDEEMTLDSMVRKAEKIKLLGIDTSVYQALSHLRKLRSRVHIKSVQHDKDTDWFSFESRHVALMKNALYQIFQSAQFDPKAENAYLLEFLKTDVSFEEQADD